MVLFKISGERNSGTNFLEQILDANGFPTFSHRIRYKVVHQWKHGIPRNDYKTLDRRVIDIFIFRELDSWLLSMFHNVYHIEKRKNFKDFLTKPNKSNENRYVDYRTNRCLNEDDNGKNIFEIREYKFNKICEYRDNNKDIIFVNLDYLCDEKNLEHFMNVLNDRYMENYKPPIQTSKLTLSMPHAKTKRNNVKHRKYNMNIEKYRDVIDTMKNEKIEDFINDLTFIIY